MSVVFTANDEPAAARQEYWRYVLREVLGPVEPRGGLPDRLLLGDVGPVRVGELETRTPGGAERTPRHVRGVDHDLCKIDVVVAGRGMIEQDGRQAALSPGDLTFIDLSRPARWAMSPAHVVAVVFPRALLPLPRDDVSRLTAVGIRGDVGTGAMVSSVARHLATSLDDGAPQARLGATVVDLFAVVLAARLGRGGELPQQTRERTLVRRIRTFIEERLGDPDLSPGMIAAAHHISIRQLYKLFSAEQTSVARWIQQRRLERCRRELLESVAPVSAIAARWGLTNASHFSRLFRGTYGIAPGDYRRLSTGPTRPDQPVRAEHGRG